MQQKNEWIDFNVHWKDRESQVSVINLLLLSCGTDPVKIYMIGKQESRKWTRKNRTFGHTGNTMHITVPHFTQIIPDISLQYFPFFILHFK